MTPLEVELLLKTYYSSEPHERMDASGVQKAYLNLVTYELIVSKVPGRYTVSVKGRAHVTQICTLGLPKQTWVGADGELIDLK